jgi:hypothetical protein
MPLVRTNRSLSIRRVASRPSQTLPTGASNKHRRTNDTGEKGARPRGKMMTCLSGSGPSNQTARTPLEPARVAGFFCSRQTLPAVTIRHRVDGGRDAILEEHHVVLCG